MKKSYLNQLVAAMCLIVFTFSAQAQYYGDATSDLPPNPEYGKCYAKCKTADVYETVTERILVKEESSRILTEPAQFETASERMLVKEASTKIEVVPATYETVTEQIMTQPPSKRYKEVPAKYETVTERILVSPESGRWVKKRVDRTCLSANPEDCMVQCWEKVPAQYKTVSKRVLSQPATTQEIEIPAKYKTVTRKVVKTPATTRVVEIPAEYKNISKTVMSAPATTRTEVIPAEYKEVTKRVLVSQGSFGGWEEILCRTDATAGKIRSVQQALKDKGYDPGPIDGVLGSQTKAALQKYQGDNGLPVGNLNIKTLESLGVN